MPTGFSRLRRSATNGSRSLRALTRRRGRGPFPELRRVLIREFSGRAQDLGGIRGGQPACRHQALREGLGVRLALVAQDRMESLAVTVPLPANGVGVESRSVGEPLLKRGSDLVIVEMTGGGQGKAVQLLEGAVTSLRADPSCGSHRVSPYSVANSVMSVIAGSLRSPKLRNMNTWSMPTSSGIDIHGQSFESEYGGWSGNLARNRS